MAWHALVLAVLAGLASFTAVVGADGGGDNKRVLIWLYDCNTQTMEALVNHSSAFTAVAPPMYAVGFDESGGAKLTDIGSYCADTVHKCLPDKELWAWVESPDSMNKTHCPDCAEDAVMRELFARPEAYIASAKMEATKHNLTGFQFDFEAPGQAVNANKTMWLATLRFHEQFAAALSAQGVLTTVATMCTANITGGTTVAEQKSFCGNGPFNHYNASATPAIMQEMAASTHVQRFISMGTYGTEMPLELNQVDWFMAHFPHQFGYGACPTCTPVSEQSASEILFRFGLARAYGIREIDMFAFGSADTAQWALYWPHLEAYLHCGDDTMPAGSCWPYA